MPDKICLGGNFAFDSDIFIKLIREVAAEEVEKRLKESNKPHNEAKFKIIDYVGDRFREIGIKDASIYGELDKLRGFASLEMFRKGLFKIIKGIDSKVIGKSQREQFIRNLYPRIQRAFKE